MNDTEPVGPIVDAFARSLRPGQLVAFADGAGSPLGLFPSLAEAARRVGGIRLLLGWCLADFEVPAGVFADVRTFIASGGLVAAVARGTVSYMPTRLSALPVLLGGPLKPDVVVLGLRPGTNGLQFGSEVAWMPAAIVPGTRVIAEVNHALPAAAVSLVVHDQIDVVAEVDRPPIAASAGSPESVATELGQNVASLVPPAAVVQFGPGNVTDAVLAALRVEVFVHSGVLVDAVVDLDRRGLLIDVPRAAYLSGTEKLYLWAHNRPIVDRIERTHDVARLAREGLVAVNTAIQIDLAGQVNVETVGGRTVGGVGGHPDFAFAGSAGHGLSIVALHSHRGGRSNLVERLDGPTTTGRSDVDFVVTEHGIADVRGTSDRERASLLRNIFGAVAAS